MQPVRFEVELESGKRTIAVKPWPHEVGLRWSMDLVEFLGDMAARGGMSPGAVIGALPKGVLLDFAQETHRNADVITKRSDGSIAAVPYLKATSFFEGRYDVTTRMMVEAAKLNFGPFFASLESAIKEALPLEDEGEAGERLASSS